MSKLNRYLGKGFAALGLTMLMTASSIAVEKVPADRTVVKISAYSGYAIIEYDPPIEADIADRTGCASVKSDREAVIDWQSDPDARAMLALVIVAQATNGQIGFGLNEYHTTKRPIIYRVVSKIS